MSSLIRKVISTAKAPAALGPYSQAVLVDRTIYISGQLGMDPASGQLVPGGVAEEAKQALTNIGEILKAAGCDFTNGYIIAGQRLQWLRTILVGLDGGQHSLFHNSLPFDLNSNQGLGGISGSVGPTALGMLIPRAVVKTTVLLADINDFSTVNDIYKEYFRSSFPARAAYQVAALPKGGRVEIEAVAVQGPLQTASL